MGDQAKVGGGGVFSALTEIQKKLVAKKSKFNGFGKYNYRSAEDIFEGLKLVLGDCSVTISDDIIQVADRIYVKSTATIHCGHESHSVSAFAREPLEKKGMDAAQVTGSASSYARKYALCAMFAIDDGVDSDSVSAGGANGSTNTITSGQADQLKRLIKESNSDTDLFLKWAKSKTISGINPEIFSRAVSMLQSKIP